MAKNSAIKFFVLVLFFRVTAVNCWANTVIDRIWAIEVTEWSTASVIVFNNSN